MKKASLFFSSICACYITCSQIPASGNVLWLRSDQGVFNDNGVTPASIGNTVRLWTDQSGNGNHFSQAAAAERPQLQVQTNVLCSRPVVRFDPGRSTYMGSSLLLSGPKSIFAVFVIPPMSGAANDIISVKGFSNEFTEVVATDFAGYAPVTFIADLASTPGGGFFQSSAGINTSFSSAGNLLCIMYDGGTNTAVSSYDAFYDATSPPVVGSGLLGRYNNDITTIGARAPFQNINYLRGDLAEIILYNRVLSAAEKDQVENYLISKYGFFGTCVVLPLTLFDFTVARANGNVHLNWKVADEEAIKEYIAEHSLDGNHWIPFETVVSKHQPAVNSYQSVHTSPVIGANYYRFRIRNVDGKDSFSPVRKLTITKNTAISVQLFPNPSSGLLRINTTEREELVSIRLVNSDGKTVCEKKMMSNDQLDISSLPSGLYIITITGNTINATQKIIKL